MRQPCRPKTQNEAIHNTENGSSFFITVAQIDKMSLIYYDMATRSIHIHTISPRGSFNPPQQCRRSSQKIFSVRWPRLYTRKKIRIQDDARC